ncbi:hypothetical protein DFH07DRAFT_958175 [Mycena maculata]|uniref:MYND-type domain-containing protein n=1 Tax=Mycena maculata TaxID=230809 RepID=A0AAD7JBA8_9AGAR|nr:hypothetical protein DFH07DRAFT_958175 [Mycena maculata]
MAEGGKELEAFLFDDDLGEFRKAAIIIEQRVAADVESEDAERKAAGEIEDVAESDLAAYVLSWFYGDISVVFIVETRPHQVRPGGRFGRCLGASLLVVTREWQLKLNRDGPEVARTPIFISAFFNICEFSDDPVVFYYVGHHIQCDAQMRSGTDWLRLLDAYTDMQHSIEQRYTWSDMTITGKWDCPMFFGCDADECLKKAMLELRKQRVRGIRNEVVEERLDKWGVKPEACAACGWTSYCSTACQKAHWAKHKSQCLEKRKSKNRS